MNKKRVNVYLDAADLARAKELGMSNVSAYVDKCISVWLADKEEKIKLNKCMKCQATFSVKLPKCPECGSVDMVMLEYKMA